MVDKTINDRLAKFFFPFCQAVALPSLISVIGTTADVKHFAESFYGKIIGQFANQLVQNRQVIRLKMLNGTPAGLFLGCHALARFGAVALAIGRSPFERFQFVAHLVYYTLSNGKAGSPKYPTSGQRPAHSGCRWLLTDSLIFKFFVVLSAQCLCNLWLTHELS